MADFQPLLDFYALDLFGTAIFPVSGCLAAARRQMDIFGALVLRTGTAIGGDALRDLVLGVWPVCWIERPAHLWVALVAGLATFAVVGVGRVPRRALTSFDALGLAVFTVIGCAVALPLVDSALVVVLMGMLSGVAGGSTRDIMSAELPLIFRAGIYATASLSGGAVFVALRALEVVPSAPFADGMATTLALRLAALRWQLALPRLGISVGDGETPHNPGRFGDA